ncbi:hypothetical protein [Hwangdonia sp.]|uniref:hypothetical protein n=1 Tax=Hwangdonia sp. TaxID=1883432 RepID=UPI003AB8F30B
MPIIFCLFIFKGFSQTYNPTPYYFSGSETLFTTVDYHPFTDDYSIGVNYYVSGPLSSIHCYLYESGQAVPGMAYSYELKREIKSSTDTPLVIYYDDVRTDCPNYMMPCDIPSHGGLKPDWASRADYSARYWLTVKVTLTI